MQLLLEHLNLKPVLALDMRLGEGTGAVLAMPIVESAICLYTRMATFTSAGVREASRMSRFSNLRGAGPIFSCRSAIQFLTRVPVPRPL